MYIASVILINGLYETKMNMLLYIFYSLIICYLIILVLLITVKL